MTIRCFSLVFLAFLSFAACSTRAARLPVGDGGAGNGDSSGETDSSSAEPSCPTGKIAFTQETGCLNDDAVEFCLQANDTLTLSQVEAIAPTVSCSHGSLGRAECDPETEQLCHLPLPSDECAFGGPLPDAPWSTICRLAALDGVGKIVPFWAE